MGLIFRNYVLIFNLDAPRDTLGEVYLEISTDTKGSIFYFCSYTLNSLNDFFNLLPLITPCLLDFLGVCILNYSSPDY